MKNFMTYIKENVNFGECIYQIGDVVKYIPFEIIGTIVNRFIDNRSLDRGYLIKWEEPYKRGHDGHCSFNDMLTEIRENDYISDKQDCWWALEDEIIPMTEEKIEEIRKREEKRKRRKEELRIRMMDVDPYGEEDWEE